jgi:hypothetical protein
MSGSVHRRQPARVWAIAALLVALVLSGFAAGRVPDPTASGVPAALSSAQTAARDATHWTGGRPARGKATTVLATARAGLVAPADASAVAASAVLLLGFLAVRRPRRRRVGRMHAGRGPPPAAWRHS